jgi:hypothetical protein
MFTNFNLSMHFAIENSEQFSYILGGGVEEHFMHFTPHILSPHTAIPCLKINKYIKYIYIRVVPNILFSIFV